jgi:hypothetical protein
LLSLIDQTILRACSASKAHKYEPMPTGEQRRDISDSHPGSMPEWAP